MKKFRIPRKIKKKLKYNLWLDIREERNFSHTLYFPYRDELAYEMYKKGLLYKI